MMEDMALPDMSEDMDPLNQDMTSDSGSDRDQAAEDQGGELILTNVCASERMETSPDGHPLMICERQHEAPPYLRLPSDSETTAYVGWRPDSLEIEHRDGSTITISQELADELFANETQMTFGQGEPNAAIGERYGHAIYRVVMEDGVPVEATPVVVIEDHVFLDVMLSGRKVQGMIARRTGEDEGSGASLYELDATLPILVEFDAAPTEDASGSPPYAPRVIKGTVLNATNATTGAMGDCLSGLDSHGAEDPFFGRSRPVEIEVYRHVNMHGAFDDVLVTVWPWDASNMGGVGFAYPIELASEDTFKLEGHASSPHGNPFYGPSMSVSEVDDAGAPCMP